MSLSKEAKALRAALQAAGVSVDACAQTLMVAAAKYIEEKGTWVTPPPVLIDTEVVERVTKKAPVKKSK